MNAPKLLKQNSCLDKIFYRKNVLWTFLFNTTDTYLNFYRTAIIVLSTAYSHKKFAMFTCILFAAKESAGSLLIILFYLKRGILPVNLFIFFLSP